MIVITDSVLIRRPLQDVFAFVSNLENLPQWAQGVQTVTRAPAGPTAAGTVFHVTGIMAGRQLSIDYRITACELNVALSATGRFGFLRFAETFRFEASADGTRVSMRNEMEPHGLFKLGTPLWRIVLGRQIRGDNRRLKQTLEAQSGRGEG